MNTRERILAIKLIKQATERPLYFKELRINTELSNKPDKEERKEGHNEAVCCS